MRWTNSAFVKELFTCVVDIIMVFVQNRRTGPSKESEKNDRREEKRGKGGGGALDLM